MRQIRMVQDVIAAVSMTDVTKTCAAGARLKRNSVKAKRRAKRAPRRTRPRRTRPQRRRPQRRRPARSQVRSLRNLKKRILVVM